MLAFGHFVCAWLFFRFPRLPQRAIPGQTFRHLSTCQPQIPHIQAAFARQKDEVLSEKTAFRFANAA